MSVVAVLPRAFLLCLLSAGCLSAAAPNMLVILADDMGWGDLRAHGNERIDTPHLDRLARESVELDRFFVAPLCAPTRAAWLTGRHHVRHHVLSPSGGLDAMPSSAVTIAEIVKQSGYATGCFGKWHNGGAPAVSARGQGFGEFMGFTGGFFPNYFDATLQRDGREEKTAGYITDVLTEAALRFIERSKSTPFLCYLPYNVPHSPMQCPDDLFDKYVARGLEPMAAAAYGMVENLDANVGRILARLDALQLAAGTIVVFFSDNGPNSDRFNGGMRGRKGSVHEGGVRVPCFIRWPGQLAPGRVSRIAQHIDLLPTLLDLAGIPPPAALDGRSLAPLLRRADAEWPDRELFTLGGQAPPDGAPIAKFPASIRTDRWRWVLERKGASLYDMQTDPSQQTDVATAHAEVSRRFRQSYERWFAEVTREHGGKVRRWPVEIGAADEPTQLNANDGARDGAVRFFGRGWDYDWATGFSSAADGLSWSLDVRRSRRVKVSVQYCSATAGGTVRVAVGEASVERTVAAAHDPVASPRPDRVVRWEVSDKAFADLDMGEMLLPAGPCRLRIVSPSGSAGLEVQSVRLTPVAAP